MIILKKYAKSLMALNKTVLCKIYQKILYGCIFKQENLLDFTFICNAMMYKSLRIRYKFRCELGGRLLNNFMSCRDSDILFHTSPLLRS